MPNWCNNQAQIVMNLKIDLIRFMDITDTHTTTSPYLDPRDEEKGYGFFDRLIPTPPEMMQGEGWWDWRIENWGTKWNPTICEFEINEDTKTISIDFDTAWAPPIAFFVKFTKLFPSSIVNLTYLEEGMAFCGKAKFSNGEVEDRYINEIPKEMYVEAGAVTNRKGEIDWDSDQNYNLWEVIDSEEAFEKYYELANY